MIDFKDEVDDFYGGQNQYDALDEKGYYQRGYKMRVEIPTFDGNMNIEGVLD